MKNKGIKALAAVGLIAALVVGGASGAFAAGKGSGSVPKCPHSRCD